MARDLAPVSRIQQRQFDRMEWSNPREFLVGLRYLELTVLTPEVEERVRRLRTNPLRKWHEARLAALFAYGISDQVLKTPVWLSKAQDIDFDFVLHWEADGSRYFYPAQLKELPPEDLNPAVTLDDIHDKLEKYSGVDNLSVVIAVNRRMRFKHGGWDRPTKPKIKELWYLGCKAPDQSRWFLHGGPIDNPKRHEFDYPQPDPA